MIIEWGEVGEGWDGGGGEGGGGEGRGRGTSAVKQTNSRIMNPNIVNVIPPALPRLL